MLTGRPVRGGGRLPTAVSNVIPCGCRSVCRALQALTSVVQDALQSPERSLLGPISSSLHVHCGTGSSRSLLLRPKPNLLPSCAIHEHRDDVPSGMCDESQHEPDRTTAFWVLAPVCWPWFTMLCMRWGLGLCAQSPSARRSECMLYSVHHCKLITVGFGSIAWSVPLVVSQVSWVQIPPEPQPFECACG